MSNNTNNSKPFLTASTIKTDKGVPYALQLEGYVASAAPYFKEATEDKKAFLNVRIGLRGPAERLMALADGTYDKDKDYGSEDDFADLRFYGPLAEKMSKVLTKGRRVVVSGPMKWEEFKRKDGSDARKIVIDVNNAVDGGSRKAGVDPTVGDNIAVATMTYTGKDNVTRSIPMAATVSGTVIGAEGLKTKGDTTYLNFGIKTNMPAEKIVDLANGTYSKDKEYDGKKTIINATMFGKSAQQLAKVIRNGAVVVVSGATQAHEYDGKVSYQIKPRNSAVTVLKYAPDDGAAAPAPAAAPAAGTAAADVAPSSDEGYFVPMEDEDDGTLPF